MPYESMLSGGARPLGTPPRRSHRSTPRLPGLNGRSVRNLRHIRVVQSIRRMVVGSIAALAVLVGAGLGLPAYAQVTSSPPEEPIAQTLRVSKIVESPSVIRDSYTATAPAPLQWPVAQHSSVSDGFGPRVPPCSGCSSFHEGTDFTAGWGARVHAVAAGVVVETAGPFNTALGVHVTIQHVIDGQVVTSVYGHMQHGSMVLRVGDKVYPGQVIGLVGSTGASTGPHLHFELLIGGTQAVNPVTWLHARLG
ncbi:MAG TPA: M23 family metallopeptidase [Terrimesophilobacter sp.]|uniref:M23 family metallopeptidase n=1 Tax=Terrimesophilobacter sp. TaxID=2906435 RepID=UPI002F954369